MKTLLIALSFFISVSVSSQSITNTLGTGGVFTIKDGSNNYLTLSQSTGEVNILRSLRLENTTSSGMGVLFKGTDRFLHNYGASNNTFLGINSGNFSMTGNDNTAVGKESFLFNTSGFHNTALGVSSLLSNTEGFYNTAIGVSALLFNAEGFYNTAVGVSSLFSNTTGNNNVALGNSSGSTITDGSNLICIGNNAQPTLGSAINQITLGDSQIVSLRCNVQTITSLSDARDKKNITDLSLGLDFIMKVKPRLFNWDKREWYDNNISDGSKMKEAPTAGFIAQELDEVQTTEHAEWLNLVLKDNPEKLEATYGNLLPVMVKAIQELKVESEKLKVENTELKSENERLSSDVELLKLMNQKIVKLEQMVNELTTVKHTTLIRTNQNPTISKEGEEK